jgi:cytoskeletal protein CcmA (bactofilin family)
MLSIFDKKNPRQGGRTDQPEEQSHSPQPAESHGFRPPATGPYSPPGNLQPGPRDQVPRPDPRPQPTGETHTTVGRGMTFHGEVKGKGSIQVDGAFIGTLDLDDEVTIGEGGQVEGNITSRLVTVFGKLKGNVLASEKVSIKDRGAIIGDVIAPRVVVSDGAVFKGRIDMEPKTAAQARNPEPLPKQPTEEIPAASTKVGGMNPPGPPPQKQ